MRSLYDVLREENFPLVDPTKDATPSHILVSEAKISVPDATPSHSESSAKHATPSHILAPETKISTPSDATPSHSESLAKPIIRLSDKDFAKLAEELLDPRALPKRRGVGRNILKGCLYKFRSVLAGRKGQAQRSVEERHLSAKHAASARWHAQ